MKPEFLRAWGRQPQHLGREGNFSTMAPVTWFPWEALPPAPPPPETHWPLTVQPSSTSSMKSALRPLAHRNECLLQALRQPCWPTHWGLFRINVLPPPQALLQDTASPPGSSEHYLHHPKAQDSSFWWFPNQGLSIKQVTDKTTLFHCRS